MSDTHLHSDVLAVYCISMSQKCTEGMPDLPRTQEEIELCVYRASHCHPWYESRCSTTDKVVYYLLCKIDQASI